MSCKTLHHRVSTSKACLTFEFFWKRFRNALSSRNTVHIREEAHKGSNDFRFYFVNLAIPEICNYVGNVKYDCEWKWCYIQSYQHMFIYLKKEHIKQTSLSPSHNLQVKRERVFVMSEDYYSKTVNSFVKHIIYTISSNHQTDFMKPF